MESVDRKRKCLRRKNPQKNPQTVLKIESFSDKIGEAS